MARNDFPDDPHNYSDAGEPTQYGNYGGTGGQAYSDYDAPYESGYPPAQPVPPRPPWYQHPAALVGLGVLTAALIVALVFAVVNLTRAGESTPAVTSTSSTPTTTSTSPSPTTATQTVTTETAAPVPTSSGQSTTSQTPTTTTAAPTTTTPPTTTSAAPTTTTAPSVTTITETTTKRLWPTLPTLRPPTLLQPPPGQ